MTEPLDIWCSVPFPAALVDELRRAAVPHRLIVPPPAADNLAGAGPDPLLAGADVAFGQPDPDQLVALPRVRWVQLTSAGYTRYDRPDLRAAMKSRGGALTTASGVYAEPCAQHLLALMLSQARQLPHSRDNQTGPRGWPYTALRSECRLIAGQTAIIYGYGAIGARLVELLAPFRLNLIAARRTPRGDEPVKTLAYADADAHLGTADYVIDILPAAPETDGYFSAARLARIRRGAVLYNIGRGTTVDQSALVRALTAGHLAAAHLDVTTPEPLPPDHTLWTTPNCHITPHTAGGHADEAERLVRHFLDNLKRLEAGKPLGNRVI